MKGKPENTTIKEKSEEISEKIEQRKWLLQKERCLFSVAPCSKNTDA